MRLVLRILPDHTQETALQQCGATGLASKLEVIDPGLKMEVVAEGEGEGGRVLLRLDGLDGLSRDQREEVYYLVLKTFPASKSAAASDGGACGVMDGLGGFGVC